MHLLRMSEPMTERSIKCRFVEDLQKIILPSNDRSNIFTKERYEKIIEEIKAAKNLTSGELSSKQRRRLKRYDILKIGDAEKLIEKTTTGGEETNIRYFCSTDNLFHIIHAAHVDTGHKRLRVMDAELKRMYCNITRQIIQIYLLLCKQCQLKKKIKRRGLVVKPILANEMNARCQVHLIDMQSESDGDFRFILNYQDHLTKFTTVLRALKTKTTEEVAYHLIDIFCLFGAPMILQSYNGRELANRIIKNLAEMWPTLKLVHGKPRHSQSQGSVERSNQDVRDMLVAWMADEQTAKWSEGLRFVQSNKNRSLHTGISKSPYEAMFGIPQRVGLKDSSLPKDLLSDIKTEEELEKLLCPKSDNEESETEHPVEEIETNSGEGCENQDRATLECTICETETSGAHKCLICGLYVHVTCGKIDEKNEGHGQDVTCNRCLRKDRINNVREHAKLGLKKQAEQMISLSNLKLRPVEIGKNVVVRVPEVDRGRLAPRNVLTVVLDVHESGLYQLGTKDAVLQTLYCRNEFTLADSNFLDATSIPSTSLSLRAACYVVIASVTAWIKNVCVAPRK